MSKGHYTEIINCTPFFCRRKRDGTCPIPFGAISTAGSICPHFIFDETVIPKTMGLKYFPSSAVKSKSFKEQADLEDQCGSISVGGLASDFANKQSELEMQNCGSCGWFARWDWCDKHGKPTCEFELSCSSWELRPEDIASRPTTENTESTEGGEHGSK